MEGLGGTEGMKGRRGRREGDKGRCVKKGHSMGENYVLQVMRAQQVENKQGKGH